MDRSPDFALLNPGYLLPMFEVEGSTAEKYDEVIRRLTQLNLRVPEGQERSITAKPQIFEVHNIIQG